MATPSDGARDLEIRICSEVDAPVVATLVAAFRDHLAASSPSDSDLARFAPVCLADPATEFSCAWLQGSPAGYSQLRFFTSIWSLGTEAHLEDLFVSESFRGRSVGRALLRHALARAREHGARIVGLNTNDHNERAHPLYLSEGFRPQSHALWPEGREVRWVMEFEAAKD
jgi:GNAT superfamily N-acetyltransferase